MICTHADFPFRSRGRSIGSFDKLCSSFEKGEDTHGGFRSKRREPDEEDMRGAAPCMVRARVRNELSAGFGDRRDFAKKLGFLAGYGGGPPHDPTRHRSTACSDWPSPLFLVKILSWSTAEASSMQYKQTHTTSGHRSRYRRRKGWLRVWVWFRPLVSCSPSLPLLPA